ncbi:uncharacterized protein BDW70DRAFT_75777 [Aspergillus foveolatus]|uniref:uncharacterized protein n=1 Tax=Aspergillus foveolatus TaxID=210207 RepID=UPI003CCD5BF8
MHFLQQRGHDGSNVQPNDHNYKAYAVASIYHSAYLEIYVTHPTRSRLEDNRDHRIDYVMTRIGHLHYMSIPRNMTTWLNSVSKGMDTAKDGRLSSRRLANGPMDGMQLAAVKIMLPFIPIIPGKILRRGIRTMTDRHSYLDNVGVKIGYTTPSK